MDSTGKGDFILIFISIIITTITVRSVLFRKSKYNLNGKITYIAAIALPLCFIITTITSLVQGGRIKDEDNKVKKNARIMGTVVFGLIPPAILIYLIYYYVSTDCNNILNK